MIGLKHILTGALVATALTGALATEAAERQVAVKASLDSASLVMGRQTTLHLEVYGDIGREGELMMPDTIWQDVEVSKIGEPEYKDVGNGRIQMLRDITIQAFDSGVYTLPPVFYIDKADTFASNRCVLKVLPVPVDTLKTVHDFADVVNPKRQILDYVPDAIYDYGLWILLLIIALCAAFFIWRRYRKHGHVLPVQTKPEEPPYDMARRQLTELQGENLWQRGEEKQFYTRMTDILRVYLQRRFGINAMEMTSTEIRHALQHNAETRASQPLMSSILSMADFVKFAKVRPLPDDNAAAMRDAMQFVEDTRPAPDAPKEDAAEKETDKSTKDKQ